MKKMMVISVLVALVLLLSTTTAYAQDEVPIYYVRLGYTGCQDGSQECPYSTIATALDKGQREVCEGRAFEIHVWNSNTSEYEYYDTRPGVKPIPGTGLPIATPLLILLIALTGLLLLILAFRTRYKTAR